MKVVLLLSVIVCVVFSSRKGSTTQRHSGGSEGGTQSAAPPKAPDFEKPENYLWFMMFGSSDSPQSSLLRFTAAVVLFGGQIALEFFKAMK